MDGNHPNRKKDKSNPYTLSVEGDAYYISFADGQGIFHKQEISMDWTIFPGSTKPAAICQNWILAKNHYLTKLPIPQSRWKIMCIVGSCIRSCTGP